MYILNGNKAESVDVVSELANNTSAARTRRDVRFVLTQ